MMWEPDCRAASLWLVEHLNLTKIGKFVQIRETESGKCITAMMRRYNELYSLAVLKECSLEEEKEQQFLMPPLNVLNIKTSWNLLHGMNFRPMTLTPSFNPRDDRNLLTEFNLVQRAFPCPKLNITHGRVLLDPSQPLYVPGETIPILCDPGYGVKMEGGFSQYITVVCSDNLVAPECVTIPPVVKTVQLTCERRIPDPVFYSVFVVVLPAVVLISMAVACNQRRRMQKLQRLIETEVKSELKITSPAEIKTNNMSN
jgi:hypothetical protein